MDIRVKPKDIRDKATAVKVTTFKVQVAKDIQAKDIKVKDKDIRAKVSVVKVSVARDNRVSVREVWVIHSLNQTKIGEQEDISQCQTGKTNSTPIFLQFSSKVAVTSVEDQECR